MSLTCERPNTDWRRQNLNWREVMLCVVQAICRRLAALRRMHFHIPGLGVQVVLLVAALGEEIFFSFDFPGQVVPDSVRVLNLRVWLFRRVVERDCFVQMVEDRVLGRERMRQFALNCHKGRPWVLQLRVPGRVDKRHRRARLFRQGRVLRYELLRLEPMRGVRTCVELKKRH